MIKMFEVIVLKLMYPRCNLKAKGGREVDFVAQGREGSRVLVQVCETMDDHQAKKREVTALNEAMSELKLASSIIITHNEENRIAVEAGQIDVVPAWRFLLNVAEQWSQGR